MSEAETPDLTTLTVELLSAYFGNNVVASEELAGLIHSTRAALAGNTAPGEEKLEAPVYKPAVSIKKSIANPDHLLSLIDGKPYKTLKRHLTSHGLTIAEYKERYKLPANYPTVAPSYSEARRETANRIGLGNRSAAAVPSPAVPTPDAAIIPEGIAAPADKPVKKAPQGIARPAKMKTAAKTKAKTKPRATKSSLSTDMEAHAPVEATAPSSPPVVDAKAVRKPRQKAVPDAVLVQPAPVTEAAKPARKPRAKLKIVAPAA